jgi:hypothetical protein
LHHNQTTYNKKGNTEMKKQELNAGVPYFISSDNTMTAYLDSINRIHEANKTRRYYVIFEDGVPVTPYRSPSSVYVTRCKTYGFNCPTHKDETGRLNCGRSAVRLMDIRGNYYQTISQAALRHKASNADGGRGARYARHLQRKAQREREAIAKPIQDGLYEAINAITGADLGRWGTDLSRLNLEQMKALTEALNATRKVGA